MKRLITILLLLALGWEAQAQIAGPVKKVVREPGNTQTTTVGTPDGSPDACYIWQGPHIVSDPHQPVITVHPIQDTETYTVKRISSNGVEEDLTLVIVEEQAEIVSVTPKYGCYSHGDKISTSDFIIVTSPEGYEDRVTLSPATAQNNRLASSSNMSVTFTLEMNGHRNERTQNILVINPDLDASEGISYNMSNLSKAIKEGSAFVKKMSDAEKKLNNYSFMQKLIPCKFQLDLNMSLPSMNLRHKCCSDHTRNEVLVVNYASTSIGGTFSCRFPFYGIPHVAQAEILLNLGLSLGIGPASGEISHNTTCCTFCIPASLTFTASGGVGASIGGDLIQADLLIQGTATAGCQWCPIGGDSFSCSVGGKVSVIGQVQLISIISASIEYPLFTYQL